MVQVGAVMTTQNRKELTYAPRLENSDSYLCGFFSSQWGWRDDE